MHPSWQPVPVNPRAANVLARTAGVHPLTAQLLLNRGVTSAVEAARFLHPSLASLEDPRVLPDLDQAVARLRRAIRREEPILLFSDSDVDGLTASVILYEVLGALGATVRARQSNRVTDGYGLPMSLVQQLAGSSITLIVLIDCGTNQSDVVQALAGQGIETIIVDHHVPLKDCAQPVALVNPHRRLGPGQELCSAGLAFKLAQGLYSGELTPGLEACLDLAALGTIADCSPFVRESRVLVAEGTGRIVNSGRRGLSMLCAATKTRQATPEHISRGLIPRLNASGRLGIPQAIWHLLLSEEAQHLDEWLRAAAAAHDTTKSLYRGMIPQAQEQVRRLHFRDQYVLIVSGRDWHPRLLGPLASSLAEQYGRPTVALSVGTRTAVGSGRSVPQFNLLEAIGKCQQGLVQFGGHAQACGVTVARSKLPAFREALNAIAKQMLGPQGLVRSLPIELELPLEALEPAWVQELEAFLPFGRGNPRPSVAIRRVHLEAKSPRTGWMTDGTRRIYAKGRFADVTNEGTYDVAVTPSVSAGELMVTVLDVKVSVGPSVPVRTADSSYISAFA